MPENGKGDEARARGAKARYHHGDLRNALIEAATALAREGGPDAVVLRAAARRVGVSPTAAYRHFTGQGDLLDAVKEYGQQRLADSMGDAGDAVPGGGGEVALERLRAMGRGYIHFARREPGLFRAAFCELPAGHVPASADTAHTYASLWEARSFAMLVEAMDALAAAGLMGPGRRQGAELSAWAMVHGLATLFIDGPLGDFSEPQIEAVVERGLDDILAGITAR